MQDERSYQILGVSPNASYDEIRTAYETLRAKYQEERFLEGERGNYAARMLTSVENAYQDIMSSRNESNSKSTFSAAFDYSDIDRLIKDDKINEAQQRLDDVDDRNAEWHYLQSVIFYKKNWMSESKKQLEIAMSLDPNNLKYKENYDKLNEKLDFNEKKFKSGTEGGGTGETFNPDQPQMGGNFCTNAMNCCSTYLCVNCLFNMCCGCR